MFNFVTIFGFTAEAKLVSSKHLIQVHLKILSRSVKNMASHLLTKYITWTFTVKILWVKSKDKINTKLQKALFQRKDLIVLAFVAINHVCDIHKWFYWERCSGAAEKWTTKQKTSEVFPSISLRWLNNALFGKEIAVGLGLFFNALG